MFIKGNFDGFKEIMFLMYVVNIITGGNFNVQVYLEHCQTSIMELFYDNSDRLKVDWYLIGFWICMENFEIVKEKPTTVYSKPYKHICF